MKSITHVAADATVSFANSEGANTAKNLDIANPEDFVLGDAKFLVTVTNPSTETDLTVSVRNKDTLNAETRYPELTSFTVPKNSPDGLTKEVTGMFVAEAVRLVISNLTATGLAGAFTAAVKVRKL